MNTYIFNNDNLVDAEINEIVTRVKAFIINENNEFLIVLSNGGCQLPGGHREDGETLPHCVIRELLEETGIKFLSKEIKSPFYEIKYYKKNYKNSGKNRISNMLFYYIKTNKRFNKDLMKLTAHEKEYNFSLEYVAIKNFEKYLNTQIETTPDPQNVAIAKEMLLAYKELRSLISEKTI